jgi:hypothetical protein
MSCVSNLLLAEYSGDAGQVAFKVPAFVPLVGFGTPRAPEGIEVYKLSTCFESREFLLNIYFEIYLR